MSDRDRRIHNRVAVEMWVEEESDNALYFQRSGDLSAGGLYLENSVPHPVGTRVRLRFTLPGETTQLATFAEIVKADIEDHLGMHLKFIDLPPDATSLIERFVERAREA